jgi:hypothetical protein
MQLYAKCRQSARLFLQPSELRLPHPLARMRVCSPSFGSLRERGLGVPIQTNFRPDPDPKPDPKLLFRIRNTAEYHIS